MKPAEYVKYEFERKNLGGIRAIARALNQSPSSVSRWCKPRSEKGCDGQVPGIAMRKILAVAKRLGLNITAEHLLYGYPLPPKHKRVA